MRRAWAVARGGYTLVELVIVILTVAAVGTYVGVRSTSTTALNTPSQAQTLASDIRRAQALATTLGKKMQVVVSVTGYAVTCVDGTPPCPNFSVASSAALVPAGTLVFDSLGRPNTDPPNANFPGASYTVGGTHTVSVAQLTGLVGVSP